MTLEQIAHHCGVDLVMVYRRRNELEAAYEVHKLPHKKGKDGKKYPTTYKKRKPQPTVEPVALDMFRQTSVADNPTEVAAFTQLAPEQHPSRAWTQQSPPAEARALLGSTADNLLVNNLDNHWWVKLQAKGHQLAHNLAQPRSRFARKVRMLHCVPSADSIGFSAGAVDSDVDALIARQALDYAGNLLHQRRHFTIPSWVKVAVADTKIHNTPPVDEDLLVSIYTRCQ
jgi:hypothetical protein